MRGVQDGQIVCNEHAFLVYVVQGVQGFYTPM